MIDAHWSLNTCNYLWFVALAFSYVASVAEKDREFFESKFSSSSEAIDNLKQQMQDLCLRLGTAEENIKIRKLLVCFRHFFVDFFHGKTFNLKII